VAASQRPSPIARSVQLRFIVSDQVDYSQRIGRDSGPRYAESLGLPCTGVSSLQDIDHGTHLIIDHTIAETEIETVRQIIERQSTPVLLKVVDPCWSRATKAPTQTPFVRLVEEYCDRPNVGVLSIHEPREWLEELIVQKQPKLLVLPYPYSLDAEQPLKVGQFGTRMDKAILSGLRTPRKYPERTKLYWRRLLSMRYRRHFDVLDHPGHADNGQPLRHQHVLGDFVRYLAGYKYCFLDPSRADLEIMKFTECAYAGCVPLGVPASSLPREARDLFLDVKTFLYAMRAHSVDRRNRDHFERAQAYRRFMSVCRRPDDLREQLLRFARGNF
jgi:hypothetical protein